MDEIGLLRFLAAFALVLGLIALMAWALKRWPVLRGMQGGPSANPRLKIIEQRGIDPRHRLVLVQRDDVQHLLVLASNGQPQIIETGIRAPEVKELS